MKRLLATLALTVPLLLGLGTPASAHTDQQAAAKVATYVVRSGDTLSAISARFCGSAGHYNSLAAASGIRNPDRIFPGDRIALVCNVTAARTATRASRAAVRSVTGWVKPLASWSLSCANSFHSPQRPGHAGLDLITAYGRSIRSVGAGTVAYIGYEDKGAGHYVVINHGTYKTVYMHMRARTFLHVGNRVSDGQTIGYVGETGNATTPHLHFEVHKVLWKVRINPAPWLRAHGIKVGC